MRSVRLALSVPVYGEHQDVLTRPEKRTELGLSVDEVRKVLDFIAFIGVPTPVHFRLRPNLRDESDNIFVELAFASGSSYLVTQNVRDFTVDTDLNLDGAVDLLRGSVPHRTQQGEIGAGGYDSKQGQRCRPRDND